MAQERVSWLKRVKNSLVEAVNRFNKVEEVVTEETDGKDSFYYVRTVGRCTRCGCGLETELDSKIMTREEYEVYLRSLPIGDVLRQRLPT